MRHTLWSALLLLPLAAQAMTIDDLTVGNTVHGPKSTLNDLKGKVVYVEYWGTR
ncbi:MAG TPA: hypothetical protein VEJ63_16500 [Planctomycetota bacterium]|nr:hypothetical protein [Planctomycetota bacterium]